LNNYSFVSQIAVKELPDHYLEQLAYGGSMVNKKKISGAH